MVDIPNPLKILGNMPVGSPGDMRDFAARLRTEASKVEGFGETITSYASYMTYEGPAAEKFRGNIADAAGKAGREAREMRDLASYLDREADQLQDTQQFYKRRFAEIEAEAASLLRAAQNKLT